MFAESALERVTCAGLPPETEPPALVPMVPEQVAGHTPAHEDSTEQSAHRQMRLLQTLPKLMIRLKVCRASLKPEAGPTVTCIHESLPAGH